MSTTHAAAEPRGNAARRRRALRAPAFFTFSGWVAVLLAAMPASAPLGVLRAVLEEERRIVREWTGTDDALARYQEELQRQLERGGAAGQSYVAHLAAQQDAAKQAGNRLEKGGRPLVAPATVFLSHCWHDGLSADDVLSAAIAVMQEGDYAWIDIYALSDGADSGGGGHVRSRMLAGPERSCDPALMARQYEEQFLHPLHRDGWRKALAAQEACGCPECLALTNRKRESAEAATATFRELAGNGRAARLGDLKRVVASTRATHVADHGGGGGGDSIAEEHEGIIASIGKVVVIANPSRGGGGSHSGPAALRRLWGLFELLCAVRTGAQLSFVVPPSRKSPAQSAIAL